MLTARLLETHVTGVASETEGHLGSEPSLEIGSMQPKEHQ